MVTVVADLSQISVGAKCP